MEEIQWTQDLFCDVEVMDSQHKVLISRFSEYMSAMKNQVSLPEVKDMLGFLRKYIVDHFAAEEALMDKYKDPVTLSHQMAHREFVSAYKKLLDDYKQDHDLPKLHDGIASMLDWFLLHIEMWDIQLGININDQSVDESKYEKIKWNSSLSCFVGLIDQQHQHLIQKFSEYVRDLSPPHQDNEKTKQMLVFLNSYIYEHFKTEEDQMQKTEYPLIKAHKQEHQTYKANYENLLNEYKEHKNVGKLQSGIVQMLQWFLKHIRQHDAPMGFYIKSKVLYRYTKKRIVIVCQSPTLSVFLNETFNHLGFAEIIIVTEEMEAWDWVKTDTVTMLVIASDHKEFEGTELLYRVRGGKEDTPVLLLPTKENYPSLNNIIKTKKLRTSDNIIVIRPFDIGRLVNKLDEKIFKHYKGTIEL